jgi:hypothetical protein
MRRGGGNSLIAWPRIGFERRLAILPSQAKTRLAWATQRVIWSFDQELVRAQAELSPEFGQDSVRQRTDSRIGSCGL